MVTVVGGGLAGCEAAWQLAEDGIPVELLEMRPGTQTPVHRTPGLGELVCSNSLRSDTPTHPAGILKREMEKMGSLIMKCARETSVPAGQALAVDRSMFSLSMTQMIQNHPLIRLRREELQSLPETPVIVATGPLTSDALSLQLKQFTSDYLYFYDAVSPVVTAESVDPNCSFWGSRYGKGSADYLNCPMNRDTYLAFHRALLDADTIPLPDHEKKLFFEGCLPLEEMARRGEETLTFGPFKPVGFTDPATGKRPHALLQLRREDLDLSTLSLVGCQTRLKWPEQKRVFRMIPALEKAEFIRYGIAHRNTYVNAPALMDRFFRLKAHPHIMLAGQITGVEGYIESAATGILAGFYMTRILKELPLNPVPDETALGGLVRHLTESDPERFLPSNITFGLIRGGSKKRKEETARQSHECIVEWIRKNELNRN